MAPADPVARAETPQIYVESSVLETTQLTGITRYTARLAIALAARADVRFFKGREEIIPPRGLWMVQDQDLGRWAPRVWGGKRRPLADVPSSAVGLYCALRPEEKLFPREVSVLHDFSPLLLPDTHTQATRDLYMGYFAGGLNSSDLVVAVSHSTKADTAWLSDVNPSRVVVAHSGPSACVTAHDHPRLVRRRADVGLVVSTLEPRKNARVLVDWFGSSTALPRDVELWWVGAVGWLQSKRVGATLDFPSNGRRVRFLGYVPDAKLCELYQKAAWSIYPSLYEGFGFPVLDALRHGTPVLTAGNSSIREFSGPGLHFFDPFDLASFDDAWRSFQRAGPVEIPLGPLDEHYNWDRVADVVLDFARGRPAYTGPHRAGASRVGVAAARDR